MAATAITNAATAAFDAETIAYRRRRIDHWDRVADRADRLLEGGAYYHRRLIEVYQFHIPPGLRVLELGCGSGDLLAVLKPARGVGIDFSSRSLHRAVSRHPELTFIEADVHELPVEGPFDVIILSDLVNDLWDVQRLFQQLQRVCAPHTRIIMNFYSRVWELPLALARRLKLAKPMLQQNWLTVEDVDNLLNLSGFETMRSWHEVIWPVRTPVIDRFMNRFLVRLWPFNLGAMANFVIARPQAGVPEEASQATVSVIIPARNEAGNIEQLIQRTPEMGGGTEIVFVEGNSTDDTYQAIERAIAAHPERQCKLLKQTGRGKGDAVRLGFVESAGDVLMILDADITVPPEDLPRFFEALVQNKGEFINGVRLVYPMEKRAMRFLNLLGNKFFSWAFSWLLGQTIKDTLCGTKVLRRRDYDLIAANRSYFGDFDPFGDFDLLFGAAKLDRKIVDLPIRYRERTYGTTNINRWSHGWLLIKMTAFAARRLRFI